MAGWQPTDVLLTSQRPSTLERLGLGRAAAGSHRPGRFGSVRIVGDTADAPERPGHDVTYQAEAGLLDDRLPITLLADLVGAEPGGRGRARWRCGRATGTDLDVGLRDALRRRSPRRSPTA